MKKDFSKPETAYPVPCEGETIAEPVRTHSEVRYNLDRIIESGRQVTEVEVRGGQLVIHLVKENPTIPMFTPEYEAYLGKLLGDEAADDLLNVAVELVEKHEILKLLET